MSVQTVLGPVSGADLGLTLMHEHLGVNIVSEYRNDGLLNDADLLAAELQQLVDVGGQTLVDVTPHELAVGGHVTPPGESDLSTRPVANVELAQELSRRTGLNVVLGTAHYRDPYLNHPTLAQSSVDEVAAYLIRNLTEGFPGTDVRAGIIGEVGSDRWFISPAEERSFRAAARAHLQTGAPITTHAARWPVGMAQLALLVEEGVQPGSVVIGHADTVPDTAYHRQVLDAGASLQFDMIRGVTPWHMERLVGWIVSLVRDGYRDQLLLSQDVCLTSHLSAFGGGGYAYLPGPFREQCLEGGLSATDFEAIMVDNPRRVLAGE
ncbi:phosphotriesterase family protein [Ornithinimicrobium sp. Y1694]|uniref:phosphotriesterase family protein n=1 Tax=Ornithinimicrobium sp. Y1694 TaxID=3418590 RepID=UPI003CF1B45F